MTVLSSYSDKTASLYWVSPQVTGNHPTDLILTIVP